MDNETAIKLALEIRDLASIIELMYKTQNDILQQYIVVSSQLKLIVRKFESEVKPMLESE